MTRCWIGVASADHVAAGVAGGFMQLGHGRHAPLARIAKGDGIVYYAPRERMGAGAPVRAFVAIGTVRDDAPSEAAATQMWRRAVDFDPAAQPAPIHPLLGELELTKHRGAHWGIAFRRSAIEIGTQDFDRIARAMHVRR